MLCFFAVFIFTFWVSRAKHNYVFAWDSKSGDIVPRDFRYVMFPTSKGVGLSDAPNGQQIEVLARALVNNQEELDAGGWVEVRNPGRTVWVRMSELQFTPPVDANVYFERFDAVYRDRNPPYYQKATCSFNPAPSGETRVTLRLRNDRRTTEYSYMVSPTGVQPRTMTTTDSLADAFDWMARIFLATTVATAATISLFFGVIVWGLATQT